MFDETQLVVRRVRSSEIGDVVSFVENVISEVYPHLISDKARPLADPGLWRQGWVAAEKAEILGAGRTAEDRITDLWVHRDHRGRKVGAALLSALEGEIAARGYKEMRLRVVAENKRARQFYAAHGWREVKTYPHERDGHLMVGLEKLG